MAIWAVPRTHVVINLTTKSDISAAGWRFLLQNRRDGNCDGEIIALRCDLDVHGSDRERIVGTLSASGFKGVEHGTEADYAFLCGTKTLSSSIPDWLSVVEVKFFNSIEKAGNAWKLADSQVYNLVGHPRYAHQKGYSCDWDPLIGKIR